MVVACIDKLIYIALGDIYFSESNLELLK